MQHKAAAGRDAQIFPSAKSSLRSEDPDHSDPPAGFLSTLMSGKQDLENPKSDLAYAPPCK